MTGMQYCVENYFDFGNVQTCIVCRNSVKAYIIFWTLIVLIDIIHWFTDLTLQIVQTISDEMFGEVACP